MSEALKLSEFLERIQDQIRGHFDETYSVVAEIASFSGTRHLYFELIEKDGNQIKAKCRANLWAFNRFRVIGHFQNTTNETLKAGMKVLLRVQPDFHTQYGFSLTIVDIDPSYSLGEFERIKRETINQLEVDGLIDMNKELELPRVLNRLAVVTSATAAGYQDFHEQLLGNAYGFAFNCVLFQCLVQGEKAPESIIEALNKVEKDKKGFDAIVLIRGGGSVIDLSCFDDYELNTILAQSTIPILTGIGHDRDFSVADRVAHTYLKTPTAVAEFIIENNALFEQSVLDAGSEILSQVQQLLKSFEFELEKKGQALKLSSYELINKEGRKLESGRENMHRVVQKQINQFDRSLNTQKSKVELGYVQLINQEKGSIEQIEIKLDLLNPLKILAKGYTMTSKSGKPISLNSINEGDIIETIGDGFKIKSKITDIQ